MRPVASSHRRSVWIGIQGLSSAHQVTTRAFGISGSISGESLVKSKYVPRFGTSQTSGDGSELTVWDHLTEYGQSKNRTGPILHRLSPPPGLYLVARSLGDLVAPGLTSGREVGLSETVPHFAV